RPEGNDQRAVEVRPQRGLFGIWVHPGKRRRHRPPPRHFSPCSDLNLSAATLPSRNTTLTHFDDEPHLYVLNFDRGWDIACMSPMPPAAAPPDASAAARSPPSSSPGPPSSCSTSASVIPLVILS